MILALTILTAGAILVDRSQAQQAPATNPQQPPAAPQAPATTPNKPPAPKTGQTSTAKKPVPLTLKTPKDKNSYAIGMNVGKSLQRNLKEGDVDVDTAILLRAIKDTLAGAKTLMTDQEVQATLTALQAEVRKRQELQAQQLAEKNKKDGDAFLSDNKTKEGVITLPSGLQYRILDQGTGPKPTLADVVVVNYRGTLLNGTEFDSSYKRGQPATFGSGQVIRGWSEALQLMPVGSKWQIFIPSDLAYGATGRRPVIGPNSTLVFDVELVAIQPKIPPAPASAAPTAPNAAPSAPATPNPSATPSPTPTPKPAPTPTPTPTLKPTSKP